MPLDPLLKLKALKSFKRDLWGDEFAHCIARITIGWGNIEYRLFWLLQAIDMKRASDWATLLFTPRMLGPRKTIVRKQIGAAIKASYPKFLEYLETQFEKFTVNSGPPQFCRSWILVRRCLRSDFQGPAIKSKERNESARRRNRG
jgi:hypothetical protein